MERSSVDGGNVRGVVPLVDGEECNTSFFLLILCCWANKTVRVVETPLGNGRSGKSMVGTTE